MAARWFELVLPSVETNDIKIPFYLLPMLASTKIKALKPSPTPTIVPVLTPASGPTDEAASAGAAFAAELAEKIPPAALPMLPMMDEIEEPSPPLEPVPRSSGPSPSLGRYCGRYCILRAATKLI